MTGRPEPGEYPDFYHQYISRMPESDLDGFLRSQGGRLTDLIGRLDAERWSLRYAAGKWSVREVVGHLIDTERIMGFRLLAIARGEQQVLPGFNENDYVANADFDTRPLASFPEEFATVRAASLSLICNLDPSAFQRSGVANGKPVTARAVAYIIGGHAEHHMAILKERYHL